MACPKFCFWLRRRTYFLNKEEHAWNTKANSTPTEPTTGFEFFVHGSFVPLQPLPLTKENKQSLDAVSNLQMSPNLFRSVVLSLLRLIGILLIGGNFPNNLRFFCVPRKYLGTLFFGSRCSFFPCFMGSNWICLPEGDHKDYHNWVFNGLFGKWERAPFYETGALLNPLMRVCFIPRQDDCFVGFNHHV